MNQYNLCMHYYNWCIPHLHEKMLSNPSMYRHNRNTSLYIQNCNLYCRQNYIQLHSQMQYMYIVHYLKIPKHIQSMKKCNSHYTNPHSYLQGDCYFLLYPFLSPLCIIFRHRCFDLVFGITRTSTASSTISRTIISTSSHAIFRA